MKTTEAVQIIEDAIRRVRALGFHVSTRSSIAVSSGMGCERHEVHSLTLEQTYVEPPREDRENREELGMGGPKGY